MFLRFKMYGLIGLSLLVLDANATEHFEKLAKNYDQKTAFSEKSAHCNEISDYQKAFDSLKTAQVLLAVNQLKQFINDYPESEKIPDCYYWLGEVLIMEGQYQEAFNIYTYIINTYPSHPKFSEAFFKIRQIQYLLNEK